MKSSFWQLVLDSQTGGLLHIIDRESGQDWVNASSPFTFGQLVHERVIHPLGRAAVGNTARFIALDVATTQLRESFAAGPIVEHATLTATEAPGLRTGPVYDELLWSGQAQYIGRAQMSWRIYHELPIVELVVTWDKLWCDLPEAAYVAFPFMAQSGLLNLETGGGWFQPGSHQRGGQLAGTISHYYTIQRAAHITTSAGQQLYWLPLDAPLVMPNAINYNNWETDDWQWNGFLASMPVNHYWHTNFATSQRGLLRLRYRFVTPTAQQTGEGALLSALPLDAYGWR